MTDDNDEQSTDEVSPMGDIAMSSAASMPTDSDESVEAQSDQAGDANRSTSEDSEVDTDDVSDKLSLSPDPDTFDRAYVEDLRKESAGYRTQLRAAQEQLHRALVEQTGLLADPADLPFDVEHLADPEALTAAIAALIEAKPHLKARRFDAGAAAQGPRVNGSEVNLADLMRERI